MSSSPSISFPFLRGLWLAGWPAQAGGSGGQAESWEFPVLQSRASAWALSVLQLGGATAPRADWFVSSCLHPASNTFRNFKNLRENFGDGLRFGVSSIEGFPLGTWIWSLWLGAVSQSEQTVSGFSLVLGSHPFPLQSHSHSASLPDSCADPSSQP